MLERAIDDRQRAGARRRSRDRGTYVARLLRRVPVGDAGLRGDDRHRRAAGRAPDPVDELVLARRGALRRVRLALRGVAQVRPQPPARRHDLQHELRAPVAGRADGVRDARRRRRAHRRHDVPHLPRAPRARGLARHRADAASRRSSSSAGRWARASCSTPTSSRAARPAAGRRWGCPGMRDQHAGCVGAYLVEHDLFDFLLLSLPDNDTHSHKNGPHAQVASIAAADAELERVMDAGGGAERVPRRARGDRRRRPLARARSSADRPHRRRSRTGACCRPSGASARHGRDRALPGAALGDGLRCCSRRAASALPRGRRDRARDRGRRPRHVAGRRRRGRDRRRARRAAFAPGDDVARRARPALDGRRRARRAAARRSRTACCVSRALPRRAARACGRR